MDMEDSLADTGGWQKTFYRICPFLIFSLIVLYKSSLTVCLFPVCYVFLVELILNLTGLIFYS